MLRLQIGPTNQPLGEGLALLREAAGWGLSPLNPRRAADMRPPCAVVLPRGRREAMLLFRSELAVTVNGARVRGGAQVVREGDRLGLEGAILTIAATNAAQRGVWQPPPAVAPPRCPVCRARLSEVAQVIRCAHCEAPHHPSCFVARAGRCGVFGCLAVSAPPEEAAG